jgi:K+-transporting ATPase ATPase C chain
MKSKILIALRVLLVMTFLTGILYPLLITGIGQLLFPTKANGNIIIKDNVEIGSKLIGQKFDSDIYFWSRPSAIDYNPLPSGGSNYGPTSKELKKLIIQRKSKFIADNMLTDTLEIPAEMLTASASGLDPHISPKAALMQANRIAKARLFNSSQKKQLIDLIHLKTENMQFSLLGEPRINVLILNLELNKLDQSFKNKK